MAFFGTAPAGEREVLSYYCQAELDVQIHLSASIDILGGESFLLSSGVGKSSSPHGLH